MVISMLKIRRPLGRLIFNMGIAIPGKTVFLIETAPRTCYNYNWHADYISRIFIVKHLVAITVRTRTTRTPAFWDTPRRHMITPILVIHIRFQVKTRQSQSYTFKKIAKKKNSILKFCKTLHTTHLLKLLDKMYKNEMNLTSRTIGARERTRDAGRTDGRTGGRTDKQTNGRTEWNQYNPNNFVVRGA